MSGIYDVTLSPGQAGRLDVIGSYAKVYSAPGGLVSLRNDAGESFALMEGQGFWMKPGEMFANITVVNKAAVAQTVLVFISDGRLDDSRITGSVAILDQIYGTTLADGASNVAITAFLATQLIAPGANLRGVLIHAASAVALAGAGGSCIARLVAAPVVPVSTGTPFNPGIILASVVSNGNADNQKSENFALARRLPIGWGLWGLFGVNVAVATSCSVGGSWTLL